jgi:Retroviral aspartyl protease.
LIGGKENKLTFLLDTGADLSVIKRPSLKSAIMYLLKAGININEISNTFMKT